ncbi:HEAT repeat domain-containing protein [Paenibacillus sp. J5C_2022]|uniref:HEAT repeat domain-containing protein n=1 Tax=Paenibacillus sp. J5C2022 TaxID=2977129 RepID=UPI0021D06E8A|nr:HEAT repeat domain-containing protein [Paenibacillus sp. J5C2022]MCU6712059.1 HEAT repeat domain-containing protein [Paenibacillus sp. J5C2022]
MNQNLPKLLTDEQMQTFIKDGVLRLKTDFSNEFHARLLEQLNDVFEHEGNPGNNVLPRIRELRKVFEHPVITGALTSVLGPNYLMHTHRHCHYNALPKAGAWHKDSYWGFERMNNHHPWWAMIMYFPQDTPIELGPTGVMPGSHNYRTRTFVQDDTEEELTANGEAGTFVLIHFDIWHRSTSNMTSQPRYMLKFEFMRTEAPSEPSWDYKESKWRIPATPVANRVQPVAMWEDTWNWLRGEIGSLYDTEPVNEEKIVQLASQLAEDDEPVALNAAYELARYGDAGKNVLLEALRSDNKWTSLCATYGLTACGQHAAEGLGPVLNDSRKRQVKHAVFALGELQHHAARYVPQIISLLDEGDVKVRRTIADVLGMIGEPAKETVEGLIACLQDEDDQVRFTAALSLLRLREAAAPAIPYLEDALEDDNRYVRGHAVEALRYINTEEAREVLINELMQSRWCSITTKTSTF